MKISMCPNIQPREHDENESRWLAENSAGDITLLPDGTVVDYNDAAARMFRLPPAVDFRGGRCQELCTDAARFDLAIEALHYSGRLENWDCEFRRWDGTPLHVVVNLLGSFDESRRLRSVRAHLFNITEWRRGHERTLLGHRVEALGRLAGGIAHDFNNLLMVVTGHAELLVSSLAPSDPLRRSAVAIQESAERASVLTRQLLAFGRRQVLQTKVLDINDLLRSLDEDLRRTFGRRIVVSLDATGDLPDVRIDPDQIEQALATLAGHAIDAMPEGGSLRVTSAFVEIGPNRPAERAFVQPGTYVQVEITHTGAALPSEAQVRLFEPFYSTDDTAPRTGLGMAVVFGIIKQSGGYIWADSAPGAGTTFTVLFPPHQPGSVVAFSQPTAAAVVPAILLVDDEEVLRKLVSAALRREGFEVLEASSMEEAQSVFAAQATKPRLVIADVHLDDGNGRQLGERLRADAPNLKLLFVSGYPDDDAETSADAGFLQKPFSMPQLVARVRQLLR